MEAEIPLSYNLQDNVLPQSVLELERHYGGTGKTQSVSIYSRSNSVPSC